MPDEVRHIRARHVATMTVAGVIEDGCVGIQDGRIVAVRRTGDLNPPRIDHDHPGLLTPGLINAHTHLELTNVPRPPTPGTFQDWLLTTMASMREPDAETFDRKRVEAVRAGVAQCLKFGVTFVGDITQNVDVVRPVLAASPLRAISFGECLGLGERRPRFTHLMKRAVDPKTAGSRMKIGVSPHAPYTVEPRDYKRALSACQETGGFLTTHLAETLDEDAFMDRHGGPFGEMYQRLGFDPGPGKRCRHHGVLGRFWNIGLFGCGALLAHMNYVPDAFLALMKFGSARVVWCPRTHAYFGHPPHRWREMMAAGITVCVGTDSCASSPDLNVMDDLRLVHRQSPDVDATTLWSLVTTQASLALSGNPLYRRRAGGCLAAGEPADLVAWPTRSADPLTEVLDEAAMLPTAVWIAGDPAAGQLET